MLGGCPPSPPHHPFPMSKSAYVLKVLKSYRKELPWSYYAFCEFQWDNFKKEKYPEMEKLFKEIEHQILDLPSISPQTQEFLGTQPFIKSMEIRRPQATWSLNDFLVTEDSTSSGFSIDIGTSVWATVSPLITGVLDFFNVRPVQLHCTMKCFQKSFCHLVYGILPHTQNTTLLLVEDKTFLAFKNLFLPFCLAFYVRKGYPTQIWWWFYWFQYHQMKDTVVDNYLFMYLYNWISYKRVTHLKWNSLRNPLPPIALILEKLGIDFIWRSIVESVKSGRIVDGHYIMEVSEGIFTLLTILLFDVPYVAMNKISSDIYFHFTGVRTKRIPDFPAILSTILTPAMASDSLVREFLSGLRFKKKYVARLESFKLMNPYVHLESNPYVSIPKENLRQDEYLIFLLQAIEGVFYSVLRAADLPRFLDFLDPDQPLLFHNGCSMRYHDRKLPPPSSFKVNCEGMKLDYEEYFCGKWPLVILEETPEEIVDYEICLPITMARDR